MFSPLNSKDNYSGVELQQFPVISCIGPPPERVHPLAFPQCVYQCTSLCAHPQTSISCRITLCKQPCPGVICSMQKFELDLSESSSDCQFTWVSECISPLITLQTTKICLPSVPQHPQWEVLLASTVLYIIDMVWWCSGASSTLYSSRLSSGTSSSGSMCAQKMCLTSMNKRYVRTEGHSCFSLN